MKRHGVTLLELIVAIAITGAAIAAGAGALGFLLDRQEKAARQLNRQASTLAARETLLRWLASARVSQERPALAFRGVDGVAEGHADDALSFLTTADTPVGGGETLVHLMIDRDSITSERGLVARLSNSAGAVAQRIELVPNAQELNLRYFSRTFAGGRWLPGWISTSALPSALELSLGAAPDDSVPLLLQLPLTVQFETGR